MEHIKNHYHYIVSALAVAGIVFAVASFSNPPLFQNTDNFILFASEEIKLEKEVQISSGDLGSNKELDIQKDVIITGNLFADEVEIDKNTQINGNVSFNKLEVHKEAKILGNQTKPVSLPIANLPEIPDFQIGTQDFKFEGNNNNLAAGSYRDLKIEKDSRLVLTGGIYNINKLEIKENSILIFSAITILNIKKELKSQQHISILQGNNNLKPTDLVINYQGENEKDGQDKKNEGGFKPIEFGKNSFLNFKLLAPKASVHIGEATTLRGQILARNVKIEKDSILIRELSGIKELDPTKVIIDSEKSIYPTNEVIVNFTSDASVVDAQSIANLVNGIIIGYIGFANAYQIQVPASTEAELDAIITQIKSLNNPKVEGAFPNFIRNLDNL